MGSPTFRLETVLGSREEYDPWGIFSDERIHPAAHLSNYDALKPWGFGHSDIVVRKAAGAIAVVGGNVSAGKGKGNKVVGKKYIALDDNGYLEAGTFLRPDGTMSSEAPQYYSVMKIEARTSNLLRPGAKR